MSEAISPDTIIGQYRVLSKIGEGGMGEVYRAHDTRLNREVAIKVLSASFAPDADRLHRFEREARATSALKTYHELLTNVLNIDYHLPADSPETAHLDQILQRCLAKDRTSRFISVAESQAQLIPALRDCPSFALHAGAALDADTFILNP